MAKKFKKHTYWLLRNVFRIVKHFEGTNSGVLNKDTVKRILLVSTTALGDTLFSTPAIRAVRKNYPASHIAVMVHKRTQEILKDNPYCDELIIYKGKYKGLYFLLKTLRRRKFDLAIILHANDPDIVPLIYISGIPCRVGWAESKFAFLLTHTYTRPKSTMHLIPYRLAIAGSVGVCDDGCSMDMFLSDEDKKDIQRYLEKNNITEKKYIGVHPFASHQSKQYDRFPELLNKALRVLDKAIFFVICGKKHASLLE